MPEIGECYTIANKLNEETPLVIKEVELSSRFPKYINKSRFDFNKFKNSKLTKVFAYGKSVWFIVESKSERIIIVSQLGMSGSWFINDNGRSTKNDHFTFIGTKDRLRYSDPRMFGKMRFFSYEKEDPAWQEKTLEHFSFGIDPATLTPSSLAKLLQDKWNKTKAIKLLMMDQNVIFGLGNYLCSEILFDAKISPFRAGNSLTQEEFAQLSKSILKIVKLAIKTGGHSFAEGFFHPDGSVGSMSKYIKAYGKEGPCPDCGGTILRTEMATRSTYFCNKCQK